MNSKNKTYDVQTDITSITFDIYGAYISIRPTTNKYLQLELSKSALVHVTDNKSELYVKQLRGLFARFRKKPVLTLFVPEHLLPSIQLKGSDIVLHLLGGIYKSLEYVSDKGEIKLVDAALGNVEVKGDNLTFIASNLTIKDNIVCAISSGEAVFENCFAKHAECRNKGGNVGVVNLNCKDALFEAERGNVTASIMGCKEDYNLTLSARDGTCNMESDEGKDCTGAFKAFTNKGNIFVEFTQKSKEV
jgi:hypothetical protein